MNGGKFDGPIRSLVVLMLLGLATSSAFAEIPLGEGGKIKVYGDVRFRAESDWDSMQSNGTKREDRDRLRIRFRAGLNYAHDEHYTLGGRLRSGAALDQQSPHQTLGDEFESKGVNIDKVFLQGAWGPGWAWAGKNGLPFWTQNELFWDEDVNPEGLAAGLSFPLPGTPLRLKPAAGYFVMEGSGSSNRFKDRSNLTAAQLAVDGKFSPVDVTAAAGLYAFKDNPNTIDAALADINYNIWVLGARGTFKGLPKPLSLGFDYMRNARNYHSSLYNGDQKTGYVLGLIFGGLKEKKDWLLGYYYAHIEKFAVVARLAQDDWIRWGSATDTRSSNFRGHEFRAAYALGPSWNVVSRLYLADAIKPETATAAAREDGKRFRVDLNMAF